MKPASKDGEEDRFRSLFDQLRSAVAVYRVVDDGSDFIFEYFNYAAELLEQVDREEVIGRSVFEVFPGIEEFGLADVIRRVWRTGQAEYHPIRLYEDDRITGWRDNHVYKLPTGEIAAVYQDATQIKRAEESLRLSKERYQRLVENLRQEYFFYSHDVRGVFTYLSPSITNILGYSEEEFLTHYTDYFTDNPINEKARRCTERSIAGEQQEPYEVEIRHRDQDCRQLEVTEVPVFDADGEVIAVEGIAHDVTTRRVMEQEMLKVQKLEALGVLAGGIAHDFNNLLTVILSNLSVAQRNPDLGADARGNLGDARQAANEAQHLTQQLLTFSRGGLPVREPLDLDQLIREVVGLATRGSNVTPRLRLGKLPVVDADPGQIHQVLSNICINAVQAMPEGGTVEVASARVEIASGSQLPLEPGPFVRIRVRDEGPGIQEKVLNRVFDPYFTTKESGTGLGLTVCYSVVRNHGGHIAVHAGIGQGSTFEVYLPAHSVASPPPRARPEKSHDGTGRVLLMDDDPAILRVAASMLTRFGCEVSTAKEGGLAVEMYQRALVAGCPFDVVILDLTVPGGLGGKDTVIMLREIDPKVRALVSSGYSNDPVMADYRRYGFVGVLTKPYAMQKMRAAVSKAMTDDDVD